MASGSKMDYLHVQSVVRQNPTEVSVPKFQESSTIKKTKNPPDHMAYEQKLPSIRVRKHYVENEFSVVLVVVTYVFLNVM